LDPALPIELECVTGIPDGKAAKVLAQCRVENVKSVGSGDTHHTGRDSDGRSSVHQSTLVDERV
jgi:hypothetical protein